MTSLTIQSIAIENFGAFKDKQTIDLRVQPGRPVLLIKALNGSGKTTLLTALQLGLYGQKAIASDRRKDYEDLLCGLRRRDVSVPAAVELVLLLDAAGLKTQLCLKRRWTFADDLVNEALSVEVLTGEQGAGADWNELVQEILPSELMHLFLFDGEKVEALANPDVLPELLRHATEVFLGIGGVDALLNDLKAVERRSVARSKDESMEFNRVRRAVEDLDGQIRRLDQQRSELVQEQAAARNDKEQAQKALARYSSQAQRRGLSAYQAAEPLRAGLETAARALESARTSLALAMSDQFTPLAWTKRLLHSYKAIWDEEQHSALRKKVWQEVKLRDERIIASLRGKQMSKSAVDLIKSVLSEDLRQLRPGRASQAVLDNADPREAERRQHHGVELLDQRVVEYGQAKRRLEGAEAAIGRLPAEEQMSDILQSMMSFTTNVAQADSRLAEITKRLDDATAQAAHLQPRLVGAQHRLATEFKEQTLEGKARESGARTRRALTIFKERLFASKAAWLSQMITAELKTFMRKQRLIKRVIVDPTSYRVSIETAGASELPMERLSAGERQILAMSVLSSLIKERKGHFPVVIDTPLARLDRDHRSTVVKNFFAKVSHQVLILSTDQEVEGATFEALSPYLSAEYALKYHDQGGFTTVVSANQAINQMGGAE